MVNTELYNEGDEQEKWDGSLHLCFSWESEQDTSKLDAGIRKYIKSCLINKSFGSVQTGESVELDYLGIPIKVSFEISE